MKGHSARVLACSLLLAGVLLLTASCAVPGLRTSSAGGLALLAETDSLAILEAAKADQKAFEVLRRSRMPEYFRGTNYPQCNEIIGRYCIEDSAVGMGRFVPGPENPDVPRARSVLLEGLRAAARRLPGDRWIQGQRVRYLVEAGDREGAVAALAGCAVNPLWWCNALLGYALHHAGRAGEAEGVFRMALAGMTPSERAAWLSPYLVLGEEDRERYLALPAEEKALAGAQFWMLADPLWTQEGNEIFSEHLVRWIETDLLLDVEPIEGSPWGEDLIEIMIRYGTAPQWVRGYGAVGMQYEMQSTFSSFVGGGLAALPEANGGQQLVSQAALGLPSAEFLHVVAPPFGIRDLMARYSFFPLDLLPPAELLFSQTVSAGRWDVEVGFPQTGYDLRMSESSVRWFSPLAHQMAVFPRGDSVVVVVTYDLPAHGLSPDLTTNAGLAILPAAGELGELRIGRAEESTGTGVLAVTAEAVPSLLSLELVIPEEAALARARYGIDLSPTSAGPAFSDLLLLENGELPESLAEAVAAARPSNRIAPGDPLGIYWEIHGLDLLDLTEVSMSLTLHPPPRGGLVGLLRGFGQTIGVVDEIQPTRTNWVEELDPAQPFMARSLGFRFPEAAEGVHIVELRAELPGRDPLIVLRAVEVTRTTLPALRPTTLVRRPVLTRVEASCHPDSSLLRCWTQASDASIYGHYGGAMILANFGYDGW